MNFANEVFDDETRENMKAGSEIVGIFSDIKNANAENYHEIQKQIVDKINETDDEGKPVHGDLVSLISQGTPGNYPDVRGFVDNIMKENYRFPDMHQYAMQDPNEYLTWFDPSEYNKYMIISAHQEAVGALAHGIKISLRNDSYGDGKAKI